VAKLTLCDSRAPSTVRLAAVLMGVGGILQFAGQAGDGRRFPVDSFQATWWPWPQLLSLIVTLGFACLIARLNGMVYWFTVVATGLGVGILVTSVVLTGLHVVEGWPISEAGIAAWLDLGILCATFALLVSRPSLRAPWAAWNGFSRP